MSKKEDLLLYIPSTLPSFNKWNTMHFMEKKKLKDKVKYLVNTELSEAIAEGIKFEKVVLHFQVMWGTETDYVINKKGKKSKKRNGNCRDVINNAPTIKLVEDCIVRSGILKDDTGDYVLSHKIYSDKIDREIKGSGIIILIENYEDKKTPSLFKHFKDHIKENHLYVKPDKQTRSDIQQGKINKQRKEKKIINDYIKQIKDKTADPKSVEELRKLFDL